MKLAYIRWMPHVNLLYPFLPASQFVAQIAPLTLALAVLEPFTVKLAEFGSFDHGQSSTIYLRPECDVRHSLALVCVVACHLPHSFSRPTRLRTYKQRLRRCIRIAMSRAARARLASRLTLPLGSAGAEPRVIESCASGSATGSRSRSP